MDNRYNRHNRRKYSLKVHVVLVTKYRKQLLKGTIADDVKQNVFDICNTNGWNVVAMETDKDHIHILVGYDTTDRVCDIVKTLKQTIRTAYGRNIRASCLNSIGRRKPFGRMVILLAV